jgi:hypothetical protein
LGSGELKIRTQSKLTQYISARDPASRKTCDIKLSTSLARWAIPADENGWPERHDWRFRKPAILSFQTAVGQRFEHLAAKRDWRVPRKYFRGKQLAAKASNTLRRREVGESWFKHNVRLCGERGSHSTANGQLLRFQHINEGKIFWEICDRVLLGGKTTMVASVV